MKNINESGKRRIAIENVCPKRSIAAKPTLAGKIEKITRFQKLPLEEFHPLSRHLPEENSDETIKNGTRENLVCL